MKKLPVDSRHTEKYLGITITYTQDKRIIVSNLNLEYYTGNIESKIVNVKKEIWDEDELQRATAGSGSRPITFKDIGATSSTIENIRHRANVYIPPSETRPHQLDTLIGYYLWVIDEDTMIADWGSYYIMKRRKKAK